MPRRVADISDARLIRQGEEAVRSFLHDAAHARDQIIPMALGLLAARREHPENVEFGRWLQSSPYSELHKDARSSLIKLGEHERLAVRVIRSSELVSPQLIWREVSKQLPLSDDQTTLPSMEQFVDRLVGMLAKLPSDKHKEKLEAVMRERSELDPAMHQNLVTALDGVITRFTHYRDLLNRVAPREPRRQGRLTNES